MRILISLCLLVFITGCVSEGHSGAFSTEFDQQEAAKTRISLGLTYLKNGNYSQAKQNLDKALEFAPRLADTHYGLAYYYQVVGEVERADDSYRTAMQLAPKNADIANSYGAFLCQEGKYEEAKNFFMQAVNAKQYANSAQTYENMALCAQSQGRGDDAIEYLISALKHQPGRAKTLFILTEMYVATEEYELAADTLRKYEKVARVSPDSLWMAIQIAKGQGDIRAANGYGDMLLRMYPDSSLARLYIERQKTQPQPVIKVKTKPQSANAEEQTVVIVTEPEPEPEPETVITAEEEASVTLENDDTQLNDTETQVPVATENAPKANTEDLPTVVEPEIETDLALTDVESTDEQATKKTVEDNEQVAKQSEQAENTGLNRTTKPLYHLVLPKENLYRLSLKYNIKLNSLKEWNNLGENGSIQVGMKLWLVPPAQQTE